MLPAKLHTRGDLRLRIELAEHLRLVRQTQGMSQRELAARMGKTKGIVTLLENTPNWRVKVFQRWTHALDLRIGFELANLPPLDKTDPLVATALERQPPHPLGEDGLALFLLIQHMNQQARAQDKTPFRYDDDTMISDLQSAARRLGSVLKINLNRAT